MAGFLPPAVFEIKAIASEAIAKFKDVNHELDKMGKEADQAGGKISKLDQASKVAMAGVMALGAAFVGFAAYGIKEANEAEQVMIKLGTTMSNVGVNTEKNRKQVEALTESYIGLGFADEDAAAGLDVLLRTTGDLDTSQKYLAISADLARVKHIDMASAASIVAKASMGNAKAFKEMGVTLDETLPKQQAIAKGMDELKNKIGGQAVNYTKTFAGQVAIMKEEFNNTAEALGTFLIPMLKSAMQGIRDGIKFIKDHSTAFTILGTAILAVTFALASYKATVMTVTAVTKAWTVVSALARAAQTFLTTGQWQLNAALNANPIGLVVAGLVLLGTTIFILWNKFEGFRKGVVKVFQVIINMVGYFVGAIGTLLTAASKIPGIGGKFKGAAEAVNNAANNVRKFGDDLDKLANKKIDIKIGGGIPDLGNNGKGGKGGGGSSAAQAAAKKANEDYMKAVKDLRDKVTTAQNKFNEKMAEAEKNYNEDVTKINAEYADKKLSIEQDYTDAVTKLNAKRDDDLIKLAEDNQKKIADITEAGQKKLQDIVQQSVDRLRDAFKKGTEFNVGDIFKGLAEAGTQSAEGLLTALRTRLNAAKELAANAAYLQAQGFSQTFIEQIVSAGPEMGNQMADALKKASPETIKELQSTYTDLERTTNTGMDVLARQMNAGGKLATDELNAAYKQAEADTRQMLAEQAQAFANSQAVIHKEFSTGMAEAASVRDKALAEAQKVMNEKLAEASKALAEAQASARKQLAEDLAAIQKDFDDKLGKIKDATASTIAAINALKAAMSSAATATMVAPVLGTPVSGAFTPTISSSTQTLKPGDKGFIGPVINTTVNASTNASPAAIASSVTNAVKYGTTVTTTSVNTATGVSNKLKAMGNMAFE